jgi:hypothetical protein
MCCQSLVVVSVVGQFRLDLLFRRHWAWPRVGTEPSCFGAVTTNSFELLKHNPTRTICAYCLCGPVVRVPG